MTSRSTEFRVPGAEGLQIRGHVHAPEDTNEPVPVLVFMHGFKGFQDWGPWGAICDRFAENGVAAIRFDLSHNGVGDDGVAFSALDRFERNTIDSELFDLAAVLDWLGSGHANTSVPIDVGRTVLLGHSRGGGGILLGAAERLGLSPGAPLGTVRNPATDRVRLRGLVTWAAIATYERGWAVEAIERWERGESVPVWNKRTEQMMPLGPQLYRDYLSRPARYDIQAATARLGQVGLPLLLVHCAQDETVPVAEASRLKDAYVHGAAADGVSGTQPGAAGAVATGAGVGVGAASDEVSGSNVGAASDEVSGSNVGAAGDGVSGRNVGGAGDEVSGSNVGAAGDGVSGSNVGDAIAGSGSGVAGGPGAAGPSVELQAVPGGDHTFGTKHPFEGWTPALESAFGHTLSFLQRVVT